ncbi:hypothetical protein J22TS3_48640 [Paenibacillus sp. J22TS3]|nr:hypothetical protein J22TS3_48640 [Paenibacillus sp. J22TS3]
MQYPSSRQVIFRRKCPDLQRSIISRTLIVYPKELGKYNSSKHEWVFINGSVIELAYWDIDADYMNYQGAEYDVIRWEELTQFELKGALNTVLHRKCHRESDRPQAFLITLNRNVCSYYKTLTGFLKVLASILKNPLIERVFAF